jgi:hypothetical protein
MRKMNIVSMTIMALTLGSIAMGQNFNPEIPKGVQVDRPDAPEESEHGMIPPPIGAHMLSNTPSAMASPATMPGGLYRLGNGYLSCPEVIG